MFHIFHKWTKWKFIGNWRVKGCPNQLISKVYERECSICGKVQRDEVSI